MTDIATDRARIEQEVGGRTLIDVLADTVAAVRRPAGVLRQAPRAGGRVLAHATPGPTSASAGSTWRPG